MLCPVNAKALYYLMEQNSAYLLNLTLNLGITKALPKHVWKPIPSLFKSNLSIQMRWLECLLDLDLSFGTCSQKQWTVYVRVLKFVILHRMVGA
ncbi:hypothetical protein AM589_00840 [Taylorella equigenitalis]|nr:hypothetical protein LW90_01090 [Taylorella equigenitalis]KOS59466.1 hypothetical protein AM589_00840 [Taylorella equigenitalis]